MNVSGVDRNVFAGGPFFVVDEELERNRLRIGFRRPVPFRAVVAKHRNALFPAQSGAFAANVEHIAPADIDVGDDSRYLLSHLFCGCSRRFFHRFLGRFGGRRLRGGFRRNLLGGSCGFLFCCCFLFRAAFGCRGLCCLFHILSNLTSN